MFFKCKACAAKDQHLESLKSEIEFLKAQLIHPNLQQANTIEANKILDGGGTVIELPEYNDYQLSELEKIKLEADRILTGSY